MELARKILSYQRFFGFEPKRSNPAKTLYLSRLRLQRESYDGYFVSGLSHTVLSTISTESWKERLRGALR
jgi:hypothetical protein